MLPFLHLLAPIFQQSDDIEALAITLSIISACCGLLLGLLAIAGMWKVFTKAGRPGWAAIIPFYNIWVMLEIVGRPGWWLVLYFIPIVNFVVTVIVAIDLAESFGHGIPFALGLFFFPYVFYIILGFGDSQYQGPVQGDKMARDWRY